MSEEEDDEYDALESDPKSALSYSVNWFLEAQLPATKFRTGLAYDQRMLSHHHPRQDHPECPERVSTIMAALEATGLAQRMHRIPVAPANDRDLSLIHSSGHISTVKSLDDPLTREVKYHHLEMRSAYASEGTVTAAYVSTGAVVSAVEQIREGQIKNALCVVRPPGHHAENDQICGFCLFDNVAVAAAVALSRCNFRRVLIFDWDIHHGNGVQHAFEDSSDVLYISIHRWEYGNFYPAGEDGAPTKVGVGPGRGYNINIGWNDTSHKFGDIDYFAAFDSIVMPAARAFEPDLVLVSAGFDAALGDPLGGCAVTPNGFGYMLHNLCSLAGGHVIVALEGGYHLSAVTASMLVCASVLLGETFPLAKSKQWQASESAKAAIRETIEAHKLIETRFSRAWTAPYTAASQGQPHGKHAWEEELPTREVVVMRSSHAGGYDNDDDDDEVVVETEDSLAEFVKSHPDTQLFVDGPTVSREATEHQLSRPPALEDGLPGLDAVCEVCSGSKGQRSMVCLRCYSVFCADKKFNGHAKEHAMSTGHKIALRLDDLEVYDFDRGHLNYMHDPELMPIVNVFYESRFGQKIPLPPSSLEGMGSSSPY